MKILLVDLCMRKEEHVFFNSAFTKIISDIYPSATIYFYGDKEHCLRVQSELNGINEIFFKYINVKSHQTWRLLGSALYSCRYILGFLRNAQRDGDIIILLNRLPICLLWVNVLNLFFKRKIISILHGELESLVNYQNIIGVTKYYYQIFRLPYLLSQSYISYIVLGESIKKNISKLNFGKANIITIDHPYDYALPLPNTIVESASVLNVGIIGKAMERKNSEKIFELAVKVFTQIKEDRIRFSIAGTVERKLKNKTNSFVHFSSSAIRLSKEEYSKTILVLTYSLLFYTSDMNKALASGSFFDCLKFEKPILALKGNSFIDYYLNKYSGIGLSFDSLDDMALFIADKNGLEYFYKTHYQEQIKAIRRAKADLSLSVLSFKLKQQL